MTARVIPLRARRRRRVRDEYACCGTPRCWHESVSTRIVAEHMRAKQGKARR